MKRTTSSRRKRWFFARSMARAYQEWLETRTRKGTRSASKPVKAKQRPLFAETLEPRVLFSGSPVPIEQDEANAEQAQQEAMAQTAELLDTGIEGIEEFSFDESADADFTEEDLERLASEAAARWEESGLTQEQIEALEKINYVVTDLEGSSVAEAEGNTIYIDDDAAGYDWFVDETESLDEEFVAFEGFLDALSDEAMEGIDLLTAIMHEQGHVLGLEDVYDPSEVDGLLYFGIQEGQRKLPDAGAATGSVVGSLQGRNALTAVNANDVTSLYAEIAAFNGATDDYQITLAATDYVLTGTSLDVNNGSHSLTIIGQGKGVTTIDADSLSRVFDIQGGTNVTLQDLTITGGYIAEGNGAGINHNGGILTLTNVEIDGNTVEDTVDNNTNALGGGLYNNGKTVVSTNTDFTNNQAVRNGGNETSGGGGIFSSGGSASLSITGGTIANNTARDGGGVYIWSQGATATFDGVTIDSNRANSVGGGFRFHDGVTIDFTNSVNLTNNSANGSGGGGYLSAASTLNLNDGSVHTVSGNKVANAAGTTIQGSGGGFYVHEGSVLNLDNTTIENNEADEGAGFYVIRRDSAVIGTNVTLQNNMAEVRGGGFRAAQQGAIVTLTDSTISGNSASTEHGGGFHNTGIVTLNNVGITNNSNGVDSNDRGGGFYNTLGEVTIAGTSSITGNTTTGHGAGFWNRDGEVTITGTAGSVINIENNEAGFGVDSAGNGAGFWATDNSTTNLTFVDFVGNIGSEDASGNLNGVGTGFYAQSASVVNLTDVNINTHSANDGGAFYVTEPQTMVTGTRVSLDGNTARSNGGAFRVAHRLATVTLTDSTIDNNTVTNAHGGGFYNSGTVNLTNTSVDGNTALDLNASAADLGGSIGSVNYRRDSYGGGFYNSGGVVNLTGTTSITNNDTYGHGGGFFSSGGEVNAVGTLIQNNEVVRDPIGLTSNDGDTHRHGGGFFSGGDGRVNLTDVIVSGNTTGTDTNGDLKNVGGGFYNTDGSTVTIDGASEITGNSAREGGGFYNSATGSVVNIVGTDAERIEIQNNTALINSGGFRSTGNTLVNLTYVDVINNIVQDQRGGGFYADGSEITGSFTRINNNHSGTVTDNGNEQGGGFWVSSSGKVTLTDSEVNGNRSESNGGGFYSENGDVSLTRTTVSNNFSENSGGGFMITGSSVFSNVDGNVNGNIARDHGGGIYITDDSKATLTRSEIDGNLAGYEDDGITRREDANAGLNGHNNGADLRGGGFRVLGRAQISLFDSAVTDNEAARYGGGFDSDNEANILFSGTTLSGNVSDYHGGGFRLANSSHFDAVNSTISGNYAGFIRAGATIAGNVEASRDGSVGGGFWVQSSGNIANLNHVTVTNNTATAGGAGGGGGIYRGSGTVTVENSIVFGNIADGEQAAAGQDVSDLRGNITLVGGNVVGSHNSGTLAISDGAYRITDDPNLGALADNGGPVQTHAILSTSSAAGAAVDSRVATDALGNGRGAVTTAPGAADLNSTGADLLTDPNFTLLDGDRTPTVTGTSINFPAGGADNENLFDYSILPANQFAGSTNYPMTVTIDLDFTKITTDQDFVFTLSDGVRTLTWNLQDNDGGKVLFGGATLFSAGEPANGVASTIKFELVLDENGSTLVATRGTGETGSNTVSTVLSPFRGFDFRARLGNSGERTQIDNFAVTYSPLVAQVEGADLGAFEADPVVETLVVDSITVPENAVVSSTSGVAAVVLDAEATTTGAGPLTYSWAATPSGSGSAITIAGQGTSSASFDYTPSVDDPIQLIDVVLTVTDTATGQIVVTDVEQIRVVHPTAMPMTFAAGQITVNTLDDENDGVRLDYNTETADFTVGQTLTGGTTGTRATIISVTDNGTDGTLVLQLIPNTGTGNFASGEAITDDGGTPGAALASSTLYDISLREALNMANASGAGNFEITFDAGVTNTNSISPSLTYRELNYDTQPGGTDFVIGEVITGASDGTQATIIDIIGDSGGTDSTGRLVLEIIPATGDGEFNDNEFLNGSISGASAGRAAGTLFESFNTGYDFDITKTNGVVFFNGNGSANTILDGNGVDRVIDIRSGANAIFKDLTITGGATALTDGNSEHGGGVKNEGGIGIFQDVIITNNSAAAGSNAGVGGGLFTTSSGRNSGLIFMTGGEISNNSSESHGGGFYMSGTNVGESLVFLDGTSISGNTAASAGGNLDDRRGGGFYITDDGNRVVFENVTVEDNKTNGRNRNDGGGGAFAGADHTIEINGGSFVRNQTGGDGLTGGSDSDGGGFWSAMNRGHLTVTGTQIGGALDGSGNIVNGNVSEDDGGGFYLEGRYSTYDFVDTQIQGNMSGDSGGGFMVANNTETLNIIQTASGNSFIKDNFSRTEHGGGFRNDGVVNINTTDSQGNASVGVFEISGNQARTDGTLLLPDGTGSTNADRVGGGFYAVSNSTTNLSDVVLENNIANRRGGAFYAAGGSIVNITSTSTATSGNEPSFISKIQNNHTVDVGDGDGGGFYVSGANTTVNLTDVLVADNTASDDGGGFLSQSNFSQTNLTRVDLVRNTAQDYGGGFYNESQDSRVTLSEVLIDSNRSTTFHGGGFRNNGAVTGNLVTITNNSANDTADGTENTTLTNNLDRVGGGFYNYQGTVTLEDAIIDGNRAYSRGGGVFNQSAGVVTITSNTIRSSISNNNVDQNSDQNNQQWRNYGSGGGVYQESAGSTVNLTGVDVRNNTAQDDGGGIFMVSDGSYGNFTDVLIQGNSAGDEGGGLMALSGGIEVTLNNVAILDNKSETIVGALRPDDQALTLGDSGHGGGISNRGVITGSNVTITGNESGEQDRIAGNDSNNVGGGVYTVGTFARFEITGANISDNDSYGRGGGIYNSEGQISLTDFVISGNSSDQSTNESQGRAGGIWNSGNGDVVLNRGALTSNTSYGHSGGIHNQDTGSTLDITNVTISDNLAGWDPNSNAFVNNRVAGGLWALSGGSANVTLRHTTISNNRTTRNGSDSGSGIRVDNSGKQVRIIDSIIFGNARDVDGSNGGPIVEDVDNNIGGDATAETNMFFEGTNIVGTTAGTITGGTISRVDPDLGVLGDNGAPAVGATVGGVAHTSIIQTHAIGAGSVAADVATTSTFTEDARGEVRSVGFGDAGAFEISAPQLDANVALTINAGSESGAGNVANGGTVTVTGDIVNEVFGSNAPLAQDVTVTVDWGDGRPFSRVVIPAGTDLSSATPDFTFEHTYAYGIDGMYAPVVSLAFTGQLTSVDEETLSVTVDDVSVITVTTNEDTPVTVGPNTTDPAATGVVSSGTLTVDDADPIADGNRLGWAVDIDGDIAVIGAEGQANREEVHIYRRDGGGNWILEQTLLNDTVDVFDDFGYAVNVDATNGRIFVGAQLDDAGNGDRGAVYYYQYDGSQWNLAQKISSVPGTNGSDQFGASLDSDGSFLAVGAYAEDSGGTNAGAAYIFTFNGATYDVAGVTKIQAESAPGVFDRAANDNFGRSIAISGNHVVVGSELNDDTGNNSGSAYVYTTADLGVTWTLEQKLAASNQGGDDRYGYDVDIDMTSGTNGRIVVGARQEDTGGSNRGSVYVYEFDGTSAWTEGQIINNGTGGITGLSNDDRLGGSVAIDGDTILTAAYQDDPAGQGTNAGRGHIFTFNGTAFEHSQSFLAGDGTQRDEFGLSVALDGDRYLVGARLAEATYTTDDGAVISMPRAGAGYIFEGTPGSATEVARIDGDLSNADFLGGRVEFGRRVAIGGDYAIVGAPGGGYANDNTDRENSGAAYVYHRNDFGTADTSDDTWSLLQKVTIGNVDTSIESGDLFGFGVTISEDGSSFAVGAHNHDDGGDRQGAVYIYTIDQTNGDISLEGRLRAAARNTTDEFGRYLSMNEDGSVLAVGMRSDDDGGSGSGAVLVYGAAGGDWNNFFSGAALDNNGVLSIESDGVKLKPTADATTTASDEFGRSVAISGNRIVVGAFDDDHVNGAGPDDNANVAARDRGSVYVFEADGTLVQKLFASNDGKDDRFGWGVDIDGDTLVVGANQEDTGGSNRGSAYVFEWDGSAWTETQKLNASDSQNNDHFGRSVSIDGDVIAVGAYLEDTGGTDAGSVYVFQRTGGIGNAFSETEILRAPDGSSRDNFGISVHVAEGNIVVGASQADRTLADGTVVSNWGAAYTYQVQDVVAAPATVTIASLDTSTITGGGTASIVNDEIVFDPGSAYDYLKVGESVVETFTYTTSAGDTASVQVTIDGRNDTPLGVDDTVTAVGEDDGLTAVGNVLTNDTDDDTGATLTVATVDGNAANVGAQVITDKGGLVTINADGTVSYDANGKFEHLAPGQTETDSITYSVTDSDGQVIYQEVDGAFVGEARDFSSNPDSWTAIDENGTNPNNLTGSRTGTFMQVPDGSGGISGPNFSDPTGSPAITYQVEVRTAGTYQLFLRGASFDGGSDSVYVAIDGHGDGAAGGNPDWYAMGISNGSFSWHGNGNIESTTAGADTAVTFNLAAGIHTIHISAREDGVALDAFMLREAGATVAAPTGTDAGPAAQQEATVTFTINGGDDPADAIDDGSFADVFTLGIDNNSGSEFEQEGGTNAAPGSATVRDDDYYFAGTYQTVGVVATDEITSDGVAGNAGPGGFERALTATDSTNRIHFNLDQSQLDDNFRVVLDTVSSNFTTGDIDLQVEFNGNVVHAETLTTDGIYTTAVFNAADVGAVAGENVITLSRTDGNGGWLQFDQILLQSGNEYATDEDTVLNVAAKDGLLANDLGDVTLSVTDLNGSGSLTGVSALGAAVAVAADGSYTYDATSSLIAQALVEGETITDTFTYTLTDGNGDTDIATVAITLSGKGDVEIRSTDILPDGTDADGNEVELRMNGNDLEIVVGGNVVHTTTDATIANADGPHSIQIDMPNDRVNLDGIGAGVFQDLTVTGGPADLGADLQTIGNQVYNSATELTADVTLTGADVTFNGTVDSDATARALTVSASGLTTFTEDVGSTNDLASLTTGGTGDVQLGGNVATLSGPSSILLDFNASLDSGTGDGVVPNFGTANEFGIQDDSPAVTVNSAPGSSLAGITQSYTFPGGSGTFSNAGIALVNSNDAAAALGDLGSAIDTSRAVIEAWVKPTDLIGNEVIWETGGGTGSGLALVGGNLAFRVIGAGKTTELSYDLATDPANALGGTAATAEFFQIAVTYDVATDTPLMYINGVLIDGTAQGAITITGAGDHTDIDGGDGMAIGAVGEANMGGWGGGTQGFSSFAGEMAAFRVFGSASDADDVTMLTNSRSFMAIAPDTEISVSTTGNQQFQNDVLLGANVTLSGTDVNFDLTVNDDGVAGTPSSLVVNAAGTTTFTGDVGTTNAFDFLTTDAAGTTVIDATTVTTNGAQTFSDNVTAGGATTTFNALEVTFGGTSALNGTTTTVNAFDATFVGDSTFAGAADLNLSDDLNFQAAATFSSTSDIDVTDDAIFEGAVVIGDASDVTANTITFNGTIDSTSGTNQDLVLNSTGNGTTSLNGAVGSTDALNSINTNTDGALQIGAGTITLAGAGVANFNDDVTLTADR